MTRLFEIHAAPEVARAIHRDGFSLQSVRSVTGAAGGPKWLSLYGLDRVLAPTLYQAAQHGGHQIDLIGSSIGAWRFASWATSSPLETLERFLATYVREDHSALRSNRKPNFSDLFTSYLDEMIDAQGIHAALANPHFRLHIVTSCFNRDGLTGKLPVTAQLAATAIKQWSSNANHNATRPQRTVFSVAAPPRTDKQWQYGAAQLTADNFKNALLASAAVPGMIPPISGESLGRSAGEQHIDGGIVDYHFRGTEFPEGWSLMPHFYPELTPRWFDKLRKSQRRVATQWQNLIVICPSPKYLQMLPGGKIPDRNDPVRLGLSKCLSHWRQAAELSVRMGEEFALALEQDQIPELITQPITQQEKRQ